MYLFILPIVQGFWLFLPDTFATDWMDGNSELEMAADILCTQLLIGFH
jgi:hypothetical protein